MPRNGRLQPFTPSSRFELRAHDLYIEAHGDPNAFHPALISSEVVSASNVLHSSITRTPWQRLRPGGIDCFIPPGLSIMPKVTILEGDLARELQVARKFSSWRGWPFLDRTEVVAGWIGAVVIAVSPVRVIEYVECIQTQLQIDSTIAVQRESLGQAGVELMIGG